jgi:glycosyltransferase involved in cell wall biosynthesis
MKVGYLHIGEPEHGIARYGRYLAAEAKTRPQLTVIEATVVLTGESAIDRQNLQAAATILSQTDIVHFQHNSSIWGGKKQLQNLNAFLDTCARPKVVTLHDLFYPLHSSLMLQQILQRKQSFGNLPSCLKTFAREQLSPNIRALRRVFDRCQIAFVCTQEEFKRLDGHTPSNKVKIVPHFVESRTLSLTPEAARKRLNLDEKIVITLLGFIYRGKGHDLLVKALANLPKNYQVVFAGGLGHESFLQEVINLAKTLGVDDRIQVTGYLSEADQELYLAATHLAVCPFEKTSASGSLCTWISANKTIMAFDFRVQQIATPCHSDVFSLHIRGAGSSYSTSNLKNGGYPRDRPASSTT